MSCIDFLQYTVGTDHIFKDVRGYVPKLQLVDPVYYAQVDLQNPQRLMRALEVCRASQRPYSSFRKQKSAGRSFQPIYLRLDWERSQLYDRINRRVDLMIKQG